MKMKVDGTINKYKIRLVVKGYRVAKKYGLFIHIFTHVNNNSHTNINSH